MAWSGDQATLATVGLQSLPGWGDLRSARGHGRQAVPQRGGGTVARPCPKAVRRLCPSALPSTDY